MEKVRQHSENDNTYFTIEIEDGKFIDASDTKDGFAIKEQEDGLFVYDSRGNLMEYDVDVGEVMDCIQKPYEFQYRLLDRLKSDCDYWLGNGNRNDKNLWAHSPDAQVEKMLNIFEDLPIKPEWLSREDIYKYADDMGVEGLKEYVEYRNQWMQEFMDDETLATTSVFYGAAKRDGEMTSSDTFADYITQHGFINSSAYLNFSDFKNSEYFTPQKDIYGISNDLVYILVEDNVDPYLTFEATLHNGDIFHIQQVTEDDRTRIVAFEHSSYSDKDWHGAPSPSGGMYEYKRPDCDIHGNAVDKLLANYTRITKSVYEDLTMSFKLMETIEQERNALKEAVTFINSKHDLSLEDVVNRYAQTDIGNVVEEFNGNSIDEFKEFLTKHIAADSENIKDLYNEHLNNYFVKDADKENTKPTHRKGKSVEEHDS